MGIIAIKQEPMVMEQLPKVYFYSVTTSIVYRLTFESTLDCSTHSDFFGEATVTLLVKPQWLFWWSHSDSFGEAIVILLVKPHILFWWSHCAYFGEATVTLLLKPSWLFWWSHSDSFGEAIVTLLVKPSWLLVKP